MFNLSALRFALSKGILAVFLAVFTVTLPGQTQPLEKKAVTDAETCGSTAYQLYRVTEGLKGVTWKQAQSLAAATNHRGMRGRLAAIPDAETHACIAARLVSEARADNAVWIGLRYWCDYRELQWADGSMVASAAFAAWDQQWSRYGTCNTNWMGVYYDVNTSRWQAVEKPKRFKYMLVQYK